MLPFVRRWLKTHAAAEISAATDFGEKLFVLRKRLKKATDIFCEWINYFLVHRWLKTQTAAEIGAATDCG
jgi:hypothetical protein